MNEPLSTATQWRDSSDFWRSRSNAFELALRQAASEGDPEKTRAIIIAALEASKLPAGAI